MTSTLATPMHASHVASLLASFSLLLPCSGQGPEQVDPPPFAIGQVANVAFDEHGAPIALGPDWEARFDAAGARFVAVLGTLTPELVDLRLGAVSVRHGDVTLPLAVEAVPEIDGDRVRYRRAAGVVERFDATLDGLAHSVLLERPLGGRGELVVTVALAGSVAAHGKQLADGTLLFSKGHGGVAIGALTAIDATGSRCPGELRLAPGGIEWVVPAAFAERAAYPLLLDPLVGTNFVLSQPLVGTGGGLFGTPYEYDSNADVAYDDSTSTWLVVWERGYWGPGTQTIRGQRFGVTGIPIGGMLSLATNTTLLLREPHVANVNRSNRFVVTWLQDTGTATQVVARAVNASDGVMSSPLTVASAALGTIEGIDIGGESSASLFAPAKAWIVWGAGASGIVGAVVTAPPNNGAVSVFQTFTVAGPPGGSTVTREPTISRMTSADGRLAVAWVRDDGAAARIRGTVIDRTGAPLYAQQILSGSDLYASAPQIDGGGDGECDFVCTWFSQSPGGIFSGPGPPHVRAGAMRAGAQLVATGPQWNVTPADSSDVAWRAGKAYITCVIADSVVLFGLDPRTCATCESIVTVASPSPPTSSAPGTRMRSPTVCMQAPSGDPTASRGVVVWTESRYVPFILGSIGAESPLYGRIVDAFSPSATTSNLGGGCGSGGTLTTVGPPAVGNGTFRIELSGAGSSALLAVLNLTPQSSPLSCGACQWLPFGATAVVSAVGGSASVPVPIPCSASLAGSTLRAQWTVWQPGSAPCALAPDFALSNIRRLNLQ